MNLIQTNAQTLQINLQQSSQVEATDSPSADGLESDSFPVVFHNQISEAASESPQIIESKELNLEIETDNSSITISPPVTAAPEFWLDSPSKAEVTFTNDSKLLVAPVLDGDSLPPAIISLTPLHGDKLPASGNILPSAVAVKAVISSSDQIEFNQKQVLQRNIQTDGTLLQKTEEQISQQNSHVNRSELSITDKLPVVSLPELESKTATEKFSDSFVAKLQVQQNAQNPILDGGLSRSQPNAVAMSNVANLASSPTPTLIDLEQLSLIRPENASEWGKGLGDRVSWMINQKLNTASIRLDPPMLGKLEISISVKDDVTSITINTQHAQTRELIENASNRLRDHLQEAGYQNVNVDVSSEQGQKRSGTDHLDDPAMSENFDLSDQADQDDVDQASRSYSSDALVDYFV